MRKNNNSKKSLHLNSETVRSLQDRDLVGVAGGTTTQISAAFCAPSHLPGCPKGPVLI